MTIRRILVAVDGSENSLAAISWAGDLAADVGASVIAVHAVGLLEHVDDAGTPASRRASLEHSFEAVWCAPLVRAGVPLERVLRDGPPVEVVLSLAEAEDVDLIVLGSRGLGGYPEQLLGSTSTQVAQRSSRPVTIVPAP